MRRAKRYIIVMGVLAGLFGLGAAAITAFLVDKNLCRELNPNTASRLNSPMLFYGISLAWMVLVYVIWLLPRASELERIVMATAALAAAATDFSLNVAALAYPALEYWLGTVGIRVSITSVDWNYAALPIAVCLVTFTIVIGSFKAEEEADEEEAAPERGFRPGELKEPQREGEARGRMNPEPAHQLVPALIMLSALAAAICVLFMRKEGKKGRRIETGH